MTLSTTLRTAIIASFFAAALPGVAALAQDTATPTPAPTETPEAPAGAPTAPAPETFVAATFNDWEIICAPVDDAGNNTCEMYQLLFDPTGQPVAEISIAALPLGAEFAAGASITTPLETFLPMGLGWRVGPTGDMRAEGFRVCTVVGCLVRMGIPAEEVDQMRAGSTATIMIAPFAAIDQPVEITVSLSGFTAAFADLQTRLAEAAVRARGN